MNWFIKRKLKNKKKYDLYETQRDIAYIKMAKADLLKRVDPKERELLAKINSSIENTRKLLENAHDKQKLEEKLAELMIQKEEQNQIINDMTLWRSHLGKLIDAEKELRAYIAML